MVSWPYLSLASAWFVYIGRSSIDGLKATPAASWEVCHEPQFNKPRASIRRAASNRRTTEDLRKSGESKIGGFGELEHLLNQVVLEEASKPAE
jgi:hypothetical protein